MEMRAATISFSKSKAKMTNTRKLQIKERLEQLDSFICDNFNSPNMNHVLKEYEKLKTELQSIYDEKGRAAIFRSNVDGSKMENVLLNTSSTLKKRITIKKPLRNSDWMMTRQHTIKT